MNLALSLGDVQLLDCDVEEPNDHLLLKPKILETKPVYAKIPVISEELCDLCGKCAEFCRYNALFLSSEKVVVFPELCHSCGGCSIVCPKKAITEEKREIGVVRKGFVDGGLEFVYGELNVGEPLPVPVIRMTKREINKDRMVIIDAPPGTACPVVSSVYGSDFCLLVTEPTPFGLHDLKMTVEVLRKMGLPLGVIVNFQGIGDRKVYDYCREEGIPILLEIPFDRRIAELYSNGIPFVEEIPEWKEKFRRILDEIKERVKP